MTTVERKVGARDSRVTPVGYGRGTGRSIDDVRRRGREALDATRGAAALALDPAVEAPATTARSQPSGSVGEREGGGALSRAGTAQPGRTRPTQPERPAIRVAPPAPVSAPRAAFVSLVIVVVLVGVLGILVINTKINENAFHLHDLRANQATLDRDEARLEGEIAVLESPNSLAVAARRLGLVRADTPAYLRLPDGRTLGMPQPAVGPTSVTAGTGAGTAGAGQPAG